MFCFAAGVFLAELEAHAPAVYAAARTAWSNAVQKEPLQPGENDMYAIPSVSIDRAVMEKSANVACVVCDLGWSDLGSFDALYGHVRHDADGNALAGAMDPVVVDSRNNLVISGERVVSLVDVEDLLVVESPDALLVAKRGSSQKVKDVVEVLKARRSGATETFPRVERPWGSYTVLHDAADCKVKRIEVAPGQRLSLHRHLQREEHWTVVSGAALVQVEKSRKYLTAGQTIMVPQHAFHRLENSGAVPTIVIETEIGSYLGEDDIERIQDDYV
jgi:mannose-1-phosphate guanylyltransferase/mannose-6-phosphate isomerase